MPYIYQQERVSLRNGISKLIEKYALGGSVLDVGAGQVLRYKSLFTQASAYKTQDIADAKDFHHDFVCDAAHIPAEDGSFDVILCTQVLEHVPDPSAVCHECSRLLKPKGYCIFTVPQTNELHEVPHDYYRYTKFGLMELAARNGLETIEIEPIGDYWTMRVRDGQRFMIAMFDLYQWPMLSRFFSWYYRFRYRLAAKMDEWFVRRDKKHLFTVGWIALMQKK